MLANLRPAGKYLMEDFYYAGGLRALLVQLGDLLDLSQRTVDGRTLGENIAGARVFNDDVIRARGQALVERRPGRAARQPGAGRRGDQAAGDGGASAGIPARRWSSRTTTTWPRASTIRRWTSAPTASSCRRTPGRGRAAGMGQLPIPQKLLKQGVRDMVRISDARMSGTSYSALCCTWRRKPMWAVRWRWCATATWWR